MTIASSARTIQQLEIISPADLRERLTQPEGQWFDRKSPRLDPKKLSEVIVAMANAEGGLVVIGIEDKKVVGIAGPGARRVNEWRQTPVTLIEPPARCQFKTLVCKREDGKDEEIAVVEVEASDHVHETSKGDVFLRVGDLNRKLSAHEAAELRYDKGDSVYDGTAIKDAKMSDLDHDLVRKYMKRIHARGPTDPALASRGLAKLVGQTMRPTVAGLLTLGKDPQRFFPHAIVRLLQYEGDAPETGARGNVRSEAIFTGAIPVQIDKAKIRLRRWLSRTVRLGSAGRFVTSTYIPQYAWLEAIVNAAVHRSYSMAGDHIRVHVFSNRLEVESPGRLPGLVRIETIRTTRFARNPRVARAVAELGYGRELGEGVDRMFEEMQAAGLPDPLFEQRSSGVIVTFLADPLSARLLRFLPGGSERFVEHLSRVGRVTTGQAATLMRVSRPTARNYLQQLEQLELIEHAGSSPNDPRGYWALNRGMRSDDRRVPPRS